MPLTQNRNAGLKWAGITLWGAGLTMEILAQTALKHKEEYCDACVCYWEEGSNRSLLYSGLGVALAGGLYCRFDAAGGTALVVAAGVCRHD